ncbi:hypothetical protein K502DRAFT_348983 [Neoconidiobolus thromboides FSU 785]|nr:hypothetical protein K502DRAFT_348983 [Neoconidiobolus thromboides FSU 785]
MSSDNNKIQVSLDNKNELIHSPVQESSQAPPPYNIEESSHIKHGIESDPLITTQPTATLINQPGLLQLTQRGPATLVCPFENIPVVTEVKYEAGLKAGLCSVAVCFLFWPMFWLPLVTKSFKEEVHFCPSCKRAIAIAP